MCRTLQHRTLQPTLQLPQTYSVPCITCVALETPGEQR